MGTQTFEVTNFQDEVLQSDQPILVDFWAEWCGPCRMIAPIVDELATEYSDKMRVAKLDADMYPEVMEMYRVMSIPTLILFKNGEPVERMVGFQPKESLLTKLEPHLS